MFKAGIISDMEEGRKGEMFLQGIDEKILATVINYVYLSELKVSDVQDIQKLVLAADMYDLPGLIRLLCTKLATEDLRGETIADLLISAHRHGAKDLRELAFNKIRANRGLCREEEFEKKMERADQKIMIDLFNNL